APGPAGAAHGAGPHKAAHPAGPAAASASSPSPRIVPHKPRGAVKRSDLLDDEPEGEEEGEESAGDDLLREEGDELDKELREEMASGSSGWDSIIVPRLLRSIGIIAAGLLGILFAIGHSYYLEYGVKRPLHHLHDMLRPSGTVGLSLGVLSAAL